MDGDEIAGISLCASRFGEDSTLALVTTLGVRRPWRRRGKAVATLSVDAQSLTGATQLYEKAGMTVYRRLACTSESCAPVARSAHRRCEPVFAGATRATNSST
jgi:hypothetical protein